MYAWEVGKVEGNLGVVADSSSITELTISARMALLVAGFARDTRPTQSEQKDAHERSVQTGRRARRCAGSVMVWSASSGRSAPSRFA